LPQEQLEYMSKALDPKMRYKVDRMRMCSRILEPHEKVDAFRTYYGHDDFRQALALLPDLIDRLALEKECHRLLTLAGKVPGRRLLALTAALKVAPRLGEEFALARLAEVPALCQTDCDAFELAKLLELSLFVAAHFSQAGVVQQMLDLFLHLLGANQERMARDERLESLVSQCFRGLRKLGLHEEIRRLLARLTLVVTHGQPFAALRMNNTWVTMVRTLLHVAAGWFYCGEEQEARQLLEEARLLLYEGELQKHEKVRLACTYIGTLAWAPVDLALVAIDELLDRLQGVFDNFATRSHFSVSKLEVVEAVVLAVVTEEFAMGQVARRWLEDDEYLVRRRIHQDVQAALGKL
jgi:cellulose synthase operon protein C